MAPTKNFKAQGIADRIWNGNSVFLTPMPILKYAHSMATVDQMDDDLFYRCAQHLQSWVDTLEDVKTACSDLTINHNIECDANPQILFTSEHVQVIYKPTGWAMSWTASIESDHKRIDKHAESTVTPIHQDDTPFGKDNEMVKANDILFWLLCNFAVDQMASNIRRDSACSYGILHRLDADTSGPVLIATTYTGWAFFQLQFRTHRIHKRYVCLVSRHMKLSVGAKINKALKQCHVPGRLARKSYVDPKGLPACTEIVAVAHLRGNSSEQSYSLVEVRLWTGRLHQIRVHMASEGHPLVSDNMYSRRKKSFCSRLFLHCYLLGFKPDAESEQVDVHCPLPIDLREALRTLHGVDPESDAMLQKWRDRGGAADHSAPKALNLRNCRRIMRCRRLGCIVKRNSSGRLMVQFKSDGKNLKIPIEDKCTEIEVGTLVEFGIVIVSIDGQDLALAVDIIVRKRCADIE